MKTRAKQIKIEHDMALEKEEGVWRFAILSSLPTWSYSDLVQVVF